MNVALLGYGYWGKIIRKYIEDSHTMSLKKIWVRSKEGYEADLFTDNVSMIMNDEGIEAVFICLPSSMHSEMCKVSLKNRKHVFCEKPLVKFGQDHDELEKLATIVGKVLYVDYIYTVSPSIQLIKEKLEELGDICLINGQIYQFGKFYNGDSVWENIGVHLISALCYWFSDIKIKKIVRHSRGNGNIELISLRDEHGMDIELECSLLSPQKKRCIYIYGKKGSICFDMLDKEATLRMNLYEMNENPIILKKEKLWKYDERNNLQISLERFESLIKVNDYRSNLMLSKQVDLLLNAVLNTEICDCYL